MGSRSSSRWSRRRFLHAAGTAAGLVSGGGWLAACAPTSSGTPPPGPAAAATSAPAAATTSAPAGLAAGAPLKLGVLLTYSGVYASGGESLTNGMQLYFDGVNNLAGGRPIVLIKEDEGSPDDSLRKARKLIEQDGVDLFTGANSSATAYAIRDLVHESKTIFICSNAGGNDLTRSRKSPYIFRTSFSNQQLNGFMGDYVYKHLGRRALTIGADYAAGREAIAAFRETYLAAGGDVSSELWTPFPSTDYAAYLTQIQQARPEVIYAFYSGSDAVNFVKQWAEFGLNRETKLAGQGGMAEQDTLPAQGAAALGVVTGMHWALTLDTPENRQFVQAYTSKFGRDPDTYSVQGYDTARVIVEALNQVQGDTSHKERLLEAIRGVKFTGPRGPFAFDENQNVVTNMYVREVRDVNGKITNVVLETLPQVRDKGA